MTLSDKVLERFRDSGMSLYELSKKSSVTRSSLRRWTDGVGRLSDKNLDAVLRALGLSVCLHDADAA